MRYQRGRVYLERTRGLNRIGQFEAKRSTQSRRALCDIQVKVDALPRFENRAETPGKSLVSCLQRAGQNFRDRDGRNREAKPPRGMGLKNGSEARPPFRVSLDEVDHGCGIYQEQRAIRQIC